MKFIIEGHKLMGGSERQLIIEGLPQIRENVERMGLKISSCGDDTHQLRRCLAASYFLNAALKQPDGTFRVLANGQTAEVHPTSVLRFIDGSCNRPSVDTVDEQMWIRCD
nr:pre-mRNA-splicing factor ATP-dependent RNA helicase DEAH10 [Tanacetum cinerariifolium]